MIEWLQWIPSNNLRVTGGWVRWSDWWGLLFVYQLQALNNKNNQIHPSYKSRSTYIPGNKFTLCYTFIYTLIHFYLISFSNVLCYCRAHSNLKYSLYSPASLDLHIFFSEITKAFSTVFPSSREFRSASPSFFQVSLSVTPNRNTILFTCQHISALNP